ncbi:alpha/beta fold hydrolase [Actinoalloteichus hymeniacidonis]|uniref:alpha/beta fold hydrolase n=1 Tax=Actinoalloteichus hymeniacidonis TaxID=340345 RepID=UPI0018396EFB|nr:alpha/beta hydrolase [Actinoalloteichus hymeniacidonis]MBB5907212.1 pimeloyl-ACP methyl ester carboxylesterase [Actinoalloteichus hymeniacidonis]
MGSHTLRDGRRLAWAEWGPSDGGPVLLCPGAATGRSLGFGGDDVDTLGVRLVSLDRPGLGASDPAPGRTLTDWASDVSEVIEALELTTASGGRPSMVGFSQGAPFALACAAAGLVSAVALVSPTDELAAPAIVELLPPQVRDLITMATTDPAAAEASFAGFADATSMREMVTQMSGPVDRAVYTAPEFDAAYRRALAEGFAQGPAGYARDTLLSMSRWPFDPAEITVPVTLWFGAHDTNPTHSPDLGRTLAERLPNAQRSELPDEGGSLLWKRAGEILRGVVGAG